MMKPGLFLALILGFVGTASASQINLFWSTTGISDPNLVYSTALTNYQPAFVPPTALPFVVQGTYDVFLWGQFPADWTDYQIYGLDLIFQGNATAGVSTYYRQRWGDHAYEKRWDNTTGITLDGFMATVTAPGIFDNLSLPNLILADGQFLIGAVRVTGTAGQRFTVALDTDGYRINCRDANGDEIPDPIVTPATIYFHPEPASFLLVLAVVLMRRR